MSENTLFEALEDVEFCDIESGTYFRMTAIYQESGKTIISIEPC